MSDNIVRGPWPAVHVPNQEDFLQMEAADSMVEDFSDAIFESLSEVFDNFDEMVYSKDYALMVHSIRSVVYKLNGQYHPCQEVADHMFMQFDDGSLNMCSGVNVDFE